MKVGCSTKAEKVVREQLPFREVKIASCTEQSSTAIMITFLCSQSSEGQTGQQQTGSQSKTAFKLCLYSEIEGMMSSWHNSDLHPRAFSSVSTHGWIRLHLPSSEEAQGGTQWCCCDQII